MLSTEMNTTCFEKYVIVSKVNFPVTDPLGKAHYISVSHITEYNIHMRGFKSYLSIPAAQGFRIHGCVDVMKGVQGDKG